MMGKNTTRNDRFDKRNKIERDQLGDDSQPLRPDTVLRRSLSFVDACVSQSGVYHAGFVSFG